jgi:hypothetical protein
MTSGARNVGERRRTRTPAHWLALTGWVATCTAHGAVDMQITPVWGGFVHPGATTEVIVHLRAATSTAVSLQARSDALELTQRVALSADSPGLATLLVRPRDGNAWIAVETRGAAVASRAVALRTTSRPMVAAASASIAPDQTWEQVELVRTAMASWPRHTEAYSSIDAVVIDGGHLAALDPAQREALETYAAGCGRLLYTGGDPLPPTLRGGCGGRFSRTVTDIETWPATAAMLRQAPSFLPSSTALRALLDAPASRVLPVAALLGAYAALLAWLARSLRRPTLLLAVPLLAALLAVVAFTATPPRLDRLLWLETDSGDASARALLLTSVTGAARAQVRLKEPDGWQLPEAADGKPLAIDDAGRLVLDTGLLSREVHVARGVQAAPSGLRLDLSASGPTITNAGDEVSAPAVLSWRGERHAVPALAPGADWTPQQATPWPDAAAERLLRARSAANGAALLVPLPSGPDRATTWLLVRASEAST